MHDTAALIEARIRRSYRERILPAAYSATAPVEVTAWEAPGEPVPFAEAVGQTFEPFEMGRMWGRPWGTTWLRVTGTVPADWPADAIELVADLGFLPSGPGFQSEGLIWSEDGVVVKGLEPKNTFVPVPAGPGESFTLYIEAASNPDVGSDWSNTRRRSATSPRRRAIRSTASPARISASSIVRPSRSSGMCGRCSACSRTCRSTRRVVPGCCARSSARSTCSTPTT